MSAVWTRRFVDFLIFIVGLAAAMLLLKSANAIAEGTFHMVSYAASSGTAITQPLGGNEALWQLQAGTVTVDNHTWLRAVRTAAQFVQFGFFAAILWQLRGPLLRIGTGEFFNEANGRALPLAMQLFLAMIAFIAAAAFRSGQQYREDSESVI